MTATDELRRMLDERGVEWTEGIARPELTQVRIDGKVVKFHPWQPNTLKVSLFDITPEQAIAATLGRGTCQQEEGGWSTEGDHARVWLTCGHDCMVETVADLPNFCPVCGAKVVSE